MNTTNTVPDVPAKEEEFISLAEARKRYPAIPIRTWLSWIRRDDIRNTKQESLCTTTNQ